jgi:hypothetical protein
MLHENGECCDSCYYLRKDVATGDYDECHYGPPIASSCDYLYLYASFPRIVNSLNQWCGRYTSWSSQYGGE